MKFGRPFRDFRNQIHAIHKFSIQRINHNRIYYPAAVVRKHGTNQTAAKNTWKTDTLITNYGHCHAGIVRVCYIRRLNILFADLYLIAGLDTFGRHNIFIRDNGTFRGVRHFLVRTET